jgi:hypothetical protein
MPLATIERLMLVSPSRFRVASRLLAARRRFLSDWNFEFPDTEPELWQSSIENQVVSSEAAGFSVVPPESQAMQPSVREFMQLEPTLAESYSETTDQSHPSILSKPQTSRPQTNHL